MEKERYLVFQIDDKFFAVEIDRAKKVIKEKGDNLRITELAQAPRHIIGIAEVEITQNEKKLITFVDFKGLSAVTAFLQEYERIYPQEKEVQEKNREEKVKTEELPEDEIAFQDILKRRIFVILSHPGKETYVGILVSKVEGISDFIEGRNAYFYPVPNIKGVKDLFTHVIIPYAREKKIFAIRTEKIFEMSEIE